MVKASREFQVFAKPFGPICNLNCSYCYYLKKKQLYQKASSFIMSDNVLEEYIVQHIEASPGQVIRFSWHGGEPTLLGLSYFKKIVALQQKHQPPGFLITNGIQTNGTLLDEDWCRFFASEGFSVGLSLDGPREMHDKYRLTKDKKPTHQKVIRAYSLLRKHHVSTDILCVVNATNVSFPLEVYRFFKHVKARYISFLPLVERQPEAVGGVSSLSVTPEAWGRFLCTIFDEWTEKDIGQIKIQIFEEAARTAFNQEHSLCIFKPICGDIPIIEHNGDFYSCDHFVDADHYLGNIKEMPLKYLLESKAQNAFGKAKSADLPRYCRECSVRAMCNGGCPKDRFIKTSDGEEGLNYLCAGYRLFFAHCQPFVSMVATEWKRQGSKVNSIELSGL
ncbi:MAG: uncharacterized protein QG670_1301 [Thermoproteota archaeon]|nr:uncharacterized protein [Thermoproteota archaeon]